MGHYAHLYSCRHAEPFHGFDEAHKDLYLLAPYCVPVFWLALYTEEDMRWGTDDPDSEFPERWPCLIAPTETAVSRLVSRREAILAVLPLICERAFDQFRECLEQVDTSYVQLVSDDIGMMAHTPNAWAEALRKMLSAFEMPLEGERHTRFWTRLLKGDGLDEGWRLFDLPKFKNGPTPAEVARLAGCSVDSKSSTWE